MNENLTVTSQIPSTADDDPVVSSSGNGEVGPTRNDPSLDPKAPPKTHFQLLEEPWSQNPTVTAALKADNATLQYLSKDKATYLDEISVVIDKMPQGLTPEAFLSEMANNVNEAVNYQPFDEYLSETGNTLNELRRRNTSTPPQTGDIYDITLRLFAELGVPDYEDEVSVMLTELTDNHFVFSPITSGKTGEHPINGSREFGFEENDDGSVTFYTRSVTQIGDVFADAGESFEGPPQTGWTDLIKGIGKEIERRGGESDLNSVSSWTTAYADVPIPSSSTGQIFGTANDDFLFGYSGKDEIFAQAGNDLLLSLEGNDFIDGGTGNDLVLAAAGNDSVAGRSGNDFVDGASGNDDLTGGEGVDFILGGAGNDFVDGASGNDDLTGGENDDNILGGTKDDRMLGGDGNDRLYGEGGNDDILGGDGDELIVGGFGQDRVLGGFGSDLVLGEDGNDTLIGRDGNDYLFGDNGNDLLVGSNLSNPTSGAGDPEMDELVGGSGHDTFVLGDTAEIYYDQGGSSAADAALIVDFNPSEDFIQLKSVTDAKYVLVPSPTSPTGEAFTTNILLEKPNQPPELIAAVQGVENLSLSGSYFVFAPPANDFTVGTAGDDLLTTSSANNEVFALAGDDLITSREGNDHIFGGSGNDLVVTAAGNDTVAGGAGDDFLAGGSEDDNLTGGEGTDFILGGVGNDFADGGSGIDHFLGGKGDDIIFGGTENDQILGDDGNDRLYGEDGDDDIFGGNGDELIVGSFGKDRILGGLGSDRVLGEDGNDTLDGDAGDDLLNGGDGNDSTNGGGGNDRIFSGAGDDRLRGGAGENLLVGASGNDFLLGEIGSDRLVGVDPFNPKFGFGKGEVDTLTGGQRSDTFVLGDTGNVYYDGGGSGQTDAAIITDFNPSEDFIQLKSIADAMYVLAPGADSSSGEASTDIFLDRSSQPLELIASVQGVTSLNLSDSYFAFV